MKIKLNPLYLALVCAGLTACGGSSNSTTTPTIEPAKVYSVNFVAETRVDGVVCADNNQNFFCDSGELQVDMTAGVATLKSEDVAILNNYYIVQNKTASIESPKMQYLASAAIVDNSEVRLSPVSSMVSALMLNGMTQEKALALIALHLNKQLTLELPTDISLLKGQAVLSEFNSKFDTMWQAITDGSAQSPALLAAMSQHLASWASITDEEMVDFSQNIVAYSSVLNSVYPMTDTGITLFADTGSFSSETQDEQFVGQDANYGLDKTSNDDSDGIAGFSYQKLNVKGEILSADAQQWSCVQDLNTGLIWENKTADGATVNDKDYLLVYIKDGRAISEGEIEEASCDSASSICTTAQYQTSLNEQENMAGLCGVKDWQLPSFDQLYSLVNFASTDAGSDGVEMAVDIKFFPNTADNDYWSSTPSVESYASMDQETKNMWTLGFNRWYMGSTTSYEYCVDEEHCDYPSALPVRLVGIK
jgi:hypothetical protein